MTTSNEIEQEFIELAYFNNDKLLIPIENLELISRYGFSEKKIQLDRLGLQNWQLKKATLKKLDSLSELGVVSIEGRANLFSAYNESKNPKDRGFFKKQIDINLKYGATFDGLEMIRDEKITRLTKFEDTYEQAESDANTLFNHKFIVEQAVVADKKTKPKRLIIIILSTLGSFIFTIFTLLINARINELKKLS